MPLTLAAGRDENFNTMTAHPSGSGLAARPAPAQPKTRGFLRVVRHGGGPQAVYIATFHRLEMPMGAPVAPAKPVLAEGAHALIELLERIGVDFNLREVRGALEDILRFGSANIPDLWLSDEEILEKGLVEQ
jgi:hypothetical protein